MGVDVAARERKTDMTVLGVVGGGAGELRSRRDVRPAVVGAPVGAASIGGGTCNAAEISGGNGDETAEDTRDRGELTTGGARLGVADGGGTANAACAGVSIKTKNNEYNILLQG